MRSFWMAFAAGGLIMSAVLLPAPAAAEGALAGAFTADSATLGFATNWAGTDLARRKAIEQCISFADNDEIKARCDIVADLHRECVAVAFGGKNYGWGMDKSLAVARQKALDMCQSMGGGISECKVNVENVFNSCDQRDSGR